MNLLLWGALAVLAAYLIGAIPFGYLIARWLKGIDIRTVGSGNIGATNVGRVLGFPFFLLVFALDMGKGLLPTLGLPWAIHRATGQPVGSLPVFVALAAILGHNFPIYLRFKGGKGVATSFGALLALDWLATLLALAAFLVFLAITRYVSVSSLMGGLFFAVGHLARVERPWGPAEAPMTVVTFALLAMLLWRHRENLARVAAGTEPKVSWGGRSRHKPPVGRVAPIVLVLLALLATGSALAYRITRPATLDCGPLRLAKLARVGTGHQRAGRVVFADGGKALAVACPRYNRVVLYRVGDESLTLVRDIALEGRPVALAAAADRLYVLQRPIADARHLEPGWWEAFDFQGRPTGARLRVGFDPDDLALTPDGRWALVLTSGHAEGEANRPSPALAVIDLGRAGSGTPREVARLAFDRPRDDPERIVLSESGRHAAVVLAGSEQVAAIDLADPERPTLIGRSPLPERERPYPSTSAFDAILMPVASAREAVVLPRRSAPPAGGYLVTTLPDASALEVFDLTSRAVLGRLPLRGPANLGSVRPTGLACAPGRGLLAVADRAGGVHLVAVRTAVAARD